MSRFWQHFLGNGFTTLAAPASPAPPADDEALDPCSRVVVQAVDKLRPALVHIRAGRGRHAAGILFSPDGLVLTNSQVVGRNQPVQLRLEDGRELAGRLVGRDSRTDLAVVQVEADGLPYAQLGDSSRLRVGQLVLAFSCPPTGDPTLTTGVISSLGQAVRGQTGHLVANVIQTDAALLPGSQGGPLVDGRGQVVGLCTPLLQPLPALCSAIPSNTIRLLLPQLLRHGQVTRGNLGVHARTITLPPLLARRFGLNQTTAAQVQAIEPDSPADQAGILEQDLIIAFGEQAITSVDDLHKHMNRLPLGVPCGVVMIRGDRRLERQIWSLRTV